MLQMSAHKRSKSWTFRFMNLETLL